MSSPHVEERLSKDFSPTATQRHYWTTHWNSDGPPRIVISDEDSFSTSMGQSHSALHRDSGGKKRPVSAPSATHTQTTANSLPENATSTHEPSQSKPAVLRRLSSAVRRQKTGAPLRVNVIKRRSALDKLDPRRDSALTESSHTLILPTPVEAVPGALITSSQPLSSGQNAELIGQSDIIPPSPSADNADLLEVSIASPDSQTEDVLVSHKVRALYDTGENLLPIEEDSTELDHSAIDRYGFLIKVTPTTRTSGDTAQSMQEDSDLKSKTSTLRRLKPPSMLHKTSRRSLRRAPSVVSRARSNVSVRSVRSYTYLHLPQNNDKKIIHNAGSMLLGPSGLVNFPEKGESRKQTIQRKKREWSREDKWRAMAKKVANANGGGTDFQFDVAHPKLVERAWKGVPDRLRATVWWSFINSAAARDPKADTEEHLVKAFYTLQKTPCPDDFQIDLDVPRTINHHELFGQRYRGGQRLLFRVLHALSLYLPEIGYTQGMAAIAVTLLCYYPEERAFVMMVRLFKYRGLADLYKPGFEGLMVCLEQFEKQYLSKKPLIAAKLEDLGITPTTYGTRWYLTLFNYSVPFHCQLRIWDVYMLLGFGVLHAASAALVDACREVLEMQGSDFENAMKLLTGFITVKDEDWMMATTKAEYQLNKKVVKAQ